MKPYKEDDDYINTDTKAAPDPITNNSKNQQEKGNEYHT